MENENNLDLRIGNNPPKKSKTKRIFKSIFFIILTIILLPFILIYYLIRGIVKLIKKKRWEKNGLRDKRLLLSLQISDIDLMEGYAFEDYLKSLFFYDGYGAQLTTKSKDYGADLILTKDDERIVVQAKRYNKIVGIKSVQEVIGAKKHYDATDSMVVTTSKFSSEAEQIAKENGVRLVDRDELIEIIKRVQEKLKITTKESELVDKANLEIEKKFPFMI